MPVIIQPKLAKYLQTVVAELAISYPAILQDITGAAPHQTNEYQLLLYAAIYESSHPNARRNRAIS